MSKVLLITSKSDVTTDFVVRALKEKKAEFFRLNTDELTKTILLTMHFNPVSAKLQDTYTGREFALDGVESVYFRRPELPEINTTDLKEGECNFIKGEIQFALEGVYKLLNNAYWVSPIYAIRQAENKVWQLEIANALGFNIPRSIISNSFLEISEFFKSHTQCIIKPIKSGLIEGSQSASVIFTSVITELPDDPEAIKCCPVYVQQEIKKIGDIRVTVIGRKVFATFIESQNSVSSKTDWRRSSTPLQHSRWKLPKDLEERCVSLLNRLNLKFGAIDLVLDEQNHYYFLEINPNGQWAWIENQTGYPLSQEIAKLLMHEISE